MSKSNTRKRVQDPYQIKARKEWYLARSIYKLDEIDHKYALFTPTTRYVLDIGCAPGSRLQYIQKSLAWKHDKCIIGLDIKQCDVVGPETYIYEQDATDRDGVQQILDERTVSSFDLIVSDMAPDTTGQKSIDAMKSVWLIEKTLWIYDTYLKAHGKFCMKVFMGPGYDELMQTLKAKYGNSAIVTFKPQATRNYSKEMFIIKR